MKITTSLLIGWAVVSLLSHSCFGQRKNFAVDSMGASAGRQDWKAAVHWAIQAAEADPSESSWRYMNAANYASNDRNADLTIQYAARVVDSEIAVKAVFGKNFDWLRQDPRFARLMEKVAELKEKQNQQRIQAALYFRQYQQKLLDETAVHIAALGQISGHNQLYDHIRETRVNHSYADNGKFNSGWVSLGDSLEFPYLVQLPPGFNPTKNYPLVVILHGAVGRPANFPGIVDSTMIPFFGNQFMEQASDFGMIAVTPRSTSRYNWMMPDDGFELVPELVRQVKRMYPIDDSRVYLAGHSNGATGAFSYLMKQPGLFAAFAGINNRPQVRTGGTFLKNGLNRSFYNVATDYDYYFPLEGHRAVTKLAKELGLDWQNLEVSGRRTHSYLIASADSAVKEMYRQLFSDLLGKQRNPYQNKLYWECDDLKHGRCDWLEISELDTLAQKSSWLTELSTPVSGWRDVYNPEIISDSISNAFVFPRRSGAVQALYSDNRFDLTTSRVKSVTIYLSPEMVDFNRPVQVFVNGKLIQKTSVTPDRAFMLAGYSREMDRQAIWASRLRVEVP